MKANDRIVKLLVKTPMSKSKKLIENIAVATHGGELTYLFNKGFFGKNPSMLKEDRIVMDAFVTSFTNFAKYGYGFRFSVPTK